MVKKGSKKGKKNIQEIVLANEEQDKGQIIKVVADGKTIQEEQLNILTQDSLQAQKLTESAKIRLKLDTPQYVSIDFKSYYDGCLSVEELILKLQQQIQELTDQKSKGFDLENQVVDGYGVLNNPKSLESCGPVSMVNGIQNEEDQEQVKKQKKDKKKSKDKQIQLQDEQQQVIATTESTADGVSAVQENGVQKKGKKGKKDKILESPIQPEQQVLPSQDIQPTQANGIKANKKKRKADQITPKLESNGIDTQVQQSIEVEKPRNKKKQKTKVAEAAIVDNGIIQINKTEQFIPPLPPVPKEQEGKEDLGDLPQIQTETTTQVTTKNGQIRHFQRVDSEKWLNHKAAADNSYTGTFGEEGWGFKAQQILGQVRGKDFRHEKTKKKRGTYRGGLIDTSAVNSFKYESDDE